MKPVIIFEKPIQAKTYVKDFKVMEENNNFIKIDKSNKYPEGAYITWGINHLISLNSSNSDIDDYLKKVKSTYKNKSKLTEKQIEQLKVVKTLCYENKVIVNACESDELGMLIFNSILDFVANEY